MFRRRPNPARAAPLQRLLVEELEPRVLFSADAEAVLPGLSWQPDQGAGQQVEATVLSAHQVRGASDADTTASQAASPRHEVAFVDGGVDNADRLVALLQQQAQADGRVLEVVRLDASADGLQQISDWLAQRKDLDAVHVFSHGQAGSLQLGSSVLDATTLAERAGELVQWSQAFGADGDLLLYGCDLAANADGRQLLSDLSLLTGTDVAASEDRTGASALGGDWVLEQSVGQVETAVALDETLQTRWQGVLATATFQQGVSSYTGTQDTVINSAAPNTADGANALLNMPTADNDAKQVLLRFDNLFSSAGGSIPDGSVITSATLRLYITEDGSGDAYLHRILSANWDESSTWNSLTNGISIDDVEASSTSAGANDLSTKNVYTTFTVTSTVQAWANGAGNLGWMLYTDGNEVAFASSENGTSAYRPLLTINYTAPTPPAVDLNGGVIGTGYTAAYVENTPVNITSSALATVTAGSNGISPNLSGMTVTISNIQNAGLESLLADVTGTSISKSYNASTGVLTLSGSDTAANYQQVLRTIQYDNASDHPSTTTRTINFVAMDPYGGNSATATASVTVTRVNDAPVITSNGGGATANVNVNETVTAVTTVVATDAEGSAITYSLGGIDASLFNLNSSTGVLTFKNAPDFESPQDSGGNNVYNVTVYASDSLLLDQQDIAITVLDMPTTLVVDTTADTNDTGLGASFNVEQLNASKGTDGKVSLREAIIAANNTAGINTVTFNITGSTGAYGEYTITLTSTLPTISDAIYLNAASQAGYTSQPLIVLDGNGGAGHGFTLNSAADGSTIRGFVIRDFSADGIHIDSGSDNHTIVGNYIGSFNADGSNAGSGERNLSEGIESYGANVVIGGTTAADRNVISGNASAYNIYLASGANGTTVQGNHIGTDAAGTSAFTSTNSAYGIMLETSASNVTIGGAATGAGNVISGFSSRGIWVTTTGTVTVQGNKIGTDVTGTIDLGNAGYGLYVDDGGTVTIGGTAAGAGNLVSGNDGGGIYVGGSVTATLQGNIVGLNASGTAALGNTGVGVYLISANATTVGGSTAAARNIISGNSSHGIEVQSSPVAGHRILGNHIGVGADGVTLLGNGGAGVYVSAHYVVVGGKNAGEGNVIAGNGGDGIAVVGGHSNFYYRNSIHSNAGLGVDLDNDGVTLNDANDGDGGANYRNNFPVITSVVTSGGSTRIHGAIDWYTGGATIYIEFFANDVVDASGHGEGKTYLGFVQVTTDASGNASFSLDVSGVSVGQWVTAIANTETTFPGASEFALAVQAVAPANGPRGKLIWNNNDQFYQYYADWFGGSTGFGGTGVNGLSYGDDISMLAAAESPVREEIIFIGSADVSGKVLAGVWDGQNWSSVLSIPIADPSDFSSQYNNFALAYDEVSGDAMLVWSNGTTGTAGLSYATWNGSSWSSIQSITAPVSGEPVHMQIAAHPSNHEMILVAHTNAASNNEYALVWNGSSWGNGQVLGTNTNRQFFELNVAYEKQSGQAMVVYDASASDSSAIQYRTWSGSSWSAEQSLSAPAGVTATSELHTVVLVSDPSSDRLALAGKNAANQVWLQVWSGSSWDGGLLATSSGVTLVDHHATMALAFEAQSGDLLAAYGTNTGPSVFYRTWTSGGGWSAQGTGPSMGGTDVPYVVKLYADPYSDTIMLGVQDNAADLNMVAWDGSGWGSVNTLDAATGFNYRENFTFVWYRDSAVISYVDGDSLSYQEDAGAVVLDQGTAATLTMGNDADYDGAVLTVSFTAGSTDGEDVLGVRNQGSGGGQVGVSGANITYGGVVVGTFSGGSVGTPLSITFNVAASDAAATAVLRNITYANTNSSTPDTTNRVVRLVVQSPLGHASAYNEVTVQVQAVNDAPVNTVPGAQSVNEDASLTFSTGNGNRINVGDVDAASGNIEVQLSVNQGVLNVPGWAATTASSLTLTGTVAQVQAWLASVVYTPTAQYTGVDTLTVTTSDLGNSGSGGTATDVDTVTINVIAANDAPVITSDGGGASAAVSLNEGTTSVTTVTASDADADTLSYSIVGGADAGRFTINASTGVLSFASAPDHEAPLDANGDNVYEVSVRVSDGTAQDTQAISVTVNNLNDNAPVITSNGGGAVATISQTEGNAAVTTVTAADADGDTLSYHIVGGLDAARFQINATTGALSFVSAPDFEAPADVGGINVYDVIVEVRDGSHTDTQVFAITITDGNDQAPVITSDGGGLSVNLNLNENIIAVTTSTATDGDSVGTLSWRIAGGADAARFVIDSGTGALGFVSAPDFEAPTDAGGNNVYDVLIEVSDGTNVDTQAIAVTVADVFEVGNPPVITSNGGGASVSLSLNENTTSVTTVAAADVDGNPLSYRIAGGADAARFAIDSGTGALSFVIAPNFDAPADAGGNNVYDVVVEVTDGISVDAQAISVTVNDLNDTAPDVTSNGGGVTAAVNVTEGSTAVTIVTATDVDTVGSVSYRIAGGADAARFTINAGTGALSFAATPDFENPQDTGADNAYEVIVEADDGLQATQQTLTVNVTDANDTAPDVISNGGGATASVNVAEGSTAVTMVTATDADTLGSVSYRIAGGADAARFTINASTGALSFAATPDFENPQDTGADNAHEVIVEADDGLQATQQTLTVNVTDTNDTAPDVTSNGGGVTAAINVSEGSTAVTTVTATDVDTVGSVSYRIAGGADAARFTINAATGALSFAATPDFESPQDAGADNAYEVIVEADDGLQATQQTLTVNVTDTNDTAPDVTSDGGGVTAAVNVTEGSTAVTMVTATDVDTVGSVSYRIAGGADAARFTINAATGALSFSATPDFESPQDAGADNAYEVIVEADDGVQATQQTLTVNVTDANDTAPDVISNGGGATASVNVSEGSTAVTMVTATDADTLGSLSYRIAGGADAARFTINASTGALSFAATPDFEDPQDTGADNAYEVIVEADDGVQATQQTLTVNVTDSNDNAPAITSDGGGAIALIQVDEGGTAVTTATATDADATASLSWGIVGGADAGRFTINASTGVLSFVQATDHEAPLDMGADNVYAVRIQVSDGAQTSWQDLLVTVRDLNDNAPVITSHSGAASVTLNHSENTQAFATLAATDADATSTLVWRINGGADAARFTIDASTGALSFVVAPDHEAPLDADTDGTYEVTVEVDDGSQTDSQALSIVVDNVNEGPAWSGATPSYTTPADAPLTVLAGGGLMSNAQDPEGDPMQTVLVSGPARGSVSLSPDGGFVYQPQAGFAGVDSFTVALSDGSLQGASRVIEVRVEAPPSAPDAVVRNPDPPSAPAPTPPSASAPTPAPAPAPAPTAPAPADPAPIRPAAPEPVVDGLGLVGPADPNAWWSRAAPAAGSDGSPMTSATPSSDTAAAGLSLRIETGAPLALLPVDSPLVAFSRLLQAPLAQAESPTASLDVAVPAIDLGGFMGWPPNAGEDGASVDVRMAQAGGAALSAGAVWWAARTSGLLASMAISAPVWRGIDPLPVLGGAKSRDDDLPEGDSTDADADIDHVFERNAAAPAGSDIALGSHAGGAR